MLIKMRYSNYRYGNVFGSTYSMNCYLWAKRTRWVAYIHFLSACYKNRPFLYFRVWDIDLLAILRSE